LWESTRPFAAEAGAPKVIALGLADHATPSAVAIRNATREKCFSLGHRFSHKRALAPLRGRDGKLLLDKAKIFFRSWPAPMCEGANLSCGGRWQTGQRNLGF